MTANRYYPALDGLRGVAALCIVLMHRGVWFGVGGLLAHAYLAVDFFFMLSGFVIASAYEEKLQGGMTIAAFIRTRLARLYPLLLLGAALGGAWEIGALITHHGDTPPREVLGLVSHALLLAPTLSHNGVGAGVFPLNPPTWSLFFELVINLVYVAILRWLTTPRLAVLVAVSLAALAMLAWRHQGIDVGGMPQVFWGGFIRVSFPFFAGVLIYRLRPLRTLRWPFWMQVLGLVGALCLPIPKGGGVLDLACVGLFFPMLLIASVNTPPRQASIRRLRAMGEFSYPLYALHYPLYVILGGIGYALGVLNLRTMFAFGAGCLLVILATSHLASIHYDRPLRAWLQRRSNRPTELKMVNAVS
jgi:peptidoglycan/LPS O-acetylase OafA/YrhL